jgi:hypothetical protein
MWRSSISPSMMWALFTFADADTLQNTLNAQTARNVRVAIRRIYCFAAIGLSVQ